MTLRASLLSELEHPALSIDRHVEACCDVSRQLENIGEYDAAQRVLNDYWPRIGEQPNVVDLDDNASAELLLRAGTLTGIIGSQRQLSASQETAKDLLTRSHAIFTARQNKKKVAETLTELGLCYWRTDELDEARSCLQEALSHLPIDSELKAKAILRLSIVEHSADRDQKALKILLQHAALFERINNHTLKGCYYTALGNRFENLGESRRNAHQLDRALIEYAAASYHLELAPHRPYLANVETNLGFLYFKINRLDEANEHLDRARRIYVSLKDARTAAQVDETRARIYLKQGRLVEAERIVRSAVRVQEKSNNAYLLTEALITYGRVLARMGKHSMALGTLRRAFDVSEQTGLENRAAEAALTAFREIGGNLAASECGQRLTGRALGEDKLSMERQVITLALEQANGKVSEAARIVGISWQGLAYALRTRHKDLSNKRSPVRPRKGRTRT